MNLAKNDVFGSLMKIYLKTMIVFSVLFVLILFPLYGHNIEFIKSIKLLSYILDITIQSYGISLICIFVIFIVNIFKNSNLDAYGKIKWFLLLLILNVFAAWYYYKDYWYNPKNNDHRNLV